MQTNDVISSHSIRPNVSLCGIMTQVSKSLLLIVNFQLVRTIMEANDVISFHSSRPRPGGPNVD